MGQLIDIFYKHFREKFFMPNDTQFNPGNSELQKSTRINKALADRGICSRRKAEELVKLGKVSVNGSVVTDLATKIAPNSEIVVEGKIFPPQKEMVFLAMNKPVRVITTMSDPQKRKTVFDLLPDHFKRLRPFPVGRLDYFSEGLLLMTNDGILAEKLAHPRYAKEKIYEVLIRGQAPREAVADMRAGLKLADGTSYLPVKMESRPAANGNTLLIMELKQGLNRQIRKMCAKWNLTILRLKRTRIGKIDLGSLRPGEIKMLNPEDWIAIL